MIELTSLATLIFSVLAVGLATYGISTIVAIEAGPFAIFDRIREVLLPPCDIESLVAVNQDGEIVPFTMDEDTRKQNKQAAFDRTLKGTIHGIFDCAVCLGAWIAFPVTLIPVWMGLINWSQFPLVGLAAYGVHRFLLAMAGDI